MKARTVEKFSLLTLGLFFLSFLVGLYAGGVFARRQSAVVAPELRRYLATYAEAARYTSLTVPQMLRSLFLYFRYPLLVFLLGFSSFGAILIPLLCALLAFSFSYSANCFVAALGAEGVALAASVLGLRYFLTFPCFCVLAAPALRTSWELTRCTLGQGAKRGAVLFDRRYFWRFFIASLVLLAGAALDLWLTPWLLALH